MPDSMTLTKCMSFLLGAVVGLVGVSIFAVILRRVEKSKPKNAINYLYGLIAFVLGAGMSDYLIFDLIFQSGAIVYYGLGLAVVFLTFGLWVFIDWMRR
jgi:hypothetical protein